MGRGHYERERWGTVASRDADLRQAVPGGIDDDATLPLLAAAGALNAAQAFTRLALAATMPASTTAAASLELPLPDAARRQVSDLVLPGFGLAATGLAGNLAKARQPLLRWTLAGALHHNTGSSRAFTLTLMALGTVSDPTARIDGAVPVAAPLAMTCRPLAPLCGSKNTRIRYRRGAERRLRYGIGRAIKPHGT